MDEWGTCLAYRPKRAHSLVPMGTSDGPSPCPPTQPPNTNCNLTATNRPIQLTSPCQRRRPLQHPPPPHTHITLLPALPTFQRVRSLCRVHFIAGPGVRAWTTAPHSLGKKSPGKKAPSKQVCQQKSPLKINTSSQCHKHNPHPPMHPRLFSSLQPPPTCQRVCAVFAASTS